MQRILLERNDKGIWQLKEFIRENRIVIKKGWGYGNSYVKSRTWGLLSYFF